MTAPLLEVEDLTVAYGPIVALRNVSLHLNAGEVLAIVGPNGAGKSTLLRTISGMMASQSGDIRLAGQSIAGQPSYAVIRQGLAHLPEGRELFREMTVLENLHLGFWTSRREQRLRDERVEEMFEHFPRLRERAGQRASTLSGGEAQMLGVARAMMSKPKVLLIDELSLGLAPLVVAKLFEIVGEANAGGMSLVLVEQFVHLALANSHRAYVLGKGEIQAHGASAELAADPALVASYLGGEAATPPTPAPRSPVEAGKAR